MYTRREFLQNALTGTAGITLFSTLPYKLFSSENYLSNFIRKDLIKITILHTNDMHSRIDPFPGNDPKYPGLGGIAKRASLIERIRRNEKNVLLLDAGDVFQGTPYFNLFGGEVEYKLMSKMKYDACVIGNHDFDNGLEGLVKIAPHADFPLICSNYDFSDTLMNGHIHSFKIFIKENIHIGVFGLGIELNGLVGKSFYGNTIYNEPLAVCQKMEVFLKEEMKCDLIICLSHLGHKYESQKIDDITIARKSANTDIIIGGHTHTFLEEPAIVKNQMNREVLVSQAGWAGIRLGRIDCFCERGSSKKIFTKANFSSVK